MKKIISATIDKELLDWLEKQLKENKFKYRNKSHIIEVALETLRKEGKK